MGKCGDQHQGEDALADPFSRESVVGGCGGRMMYLGGP